MNINDQNRSRGDIEPSFGSQHPFHSLINELEQEFDRIFDQFSRPMRGSRGLPSRSERSPQGSRSLGPMNQTNQMMGPAVDVEETQDQFLIHFDVPGIRREDIKIELADNQLIVSGERRKEERDKSGINSYSERVYGRFSRSFTLPQNVDPQKIEASYDHGVLMLSLPKIQATKSRQIPVNEGRAQLHQNNQNQGQGQNMQ